MATNNKKTKATQPTAPIVPPINSNYIKNLRGNYIKTLSQGLSVRITDGDITYFTAPITNISAWKITGNQIELIGPEPVVLQFTSNSEATSGLNNLINCLNGGLVI